MLVLIAVWLTAGVETTRLTIPEVQDYKECEELATILRETDDHPNAIYCKHAEQY